MAKRTISEELAKYGYVFRLKNTLILYGVIFALMILLGQYFGLKLIPQMIVLGFTGVMLFFFIRNTLRSRYNQKRFDDLNVYMEQFLYSFQKSGKILTTLTEVGDLFEKGEMKSAIEDAVAIILGDYEGRNPEKKALRQMELEYPYSGLRNIHRLALDAEKNGGNCEGSIRLLLAGRQMWADRNYRFLNEKKHQRNKVGLSILATLGLAAMVQYMGKRIGMDLSSNGISQAATVVLLCADLLIFYLADKKFAQDDAISDTEDVRDALASKEYLGKYGPEGKGFIHKLGCRAAKRRVTRQIEKDFPKWLMQVALYLQSENVHVAVMKSSHDAPLILREDLKDFLEELDLDPVSIRPYLDFLKDYTLPEVHSAMKMLYSVSEGKGGEAAAQIQELIQRNQKLLDRSEILQNEDRMSGMFALFLFPQITGGGKMLCDLVLLFVTYISTIGSQVMG